MLKLTQSILVLSLMGTLSSTARADGEGVPGFSGNPDDTALAERAPAPTAAAILAAYRGSNQPYVGASDTGGNWHRAAVQARSRAETDLRSARAQLAQARAEVARLIAEIRIEGAESVDIGGEVRAARMVEAEWQRAVDAIIAHIGKIDAAIVMHGGEAPEEQLMRQSLK
jgi:hypothetical protein